jgi:hypothetical protein
LSVAALGAVLLFADRFPFLGRLPGDIHVEGKQAYFHFPLTTCLLLSVVLTVVINVVIRLLKK